MTQRLAERLGTRDWFRPEEVEAMAADLGLRLATSPRMAAGLLNSVVMHYRAIIHEHLEGKRLTAAHRANAIQAKRRLTAARSLHRMLADEHDGFTGPFPTPDNRALRCELFWLAHRAETAMRPLARCCMPEHGTRDMLGGALPAAFKSIFCEQSIAVRDRFISAWCKFLGFGTNRTAIKQHVTRFNRAKRLGVVRDLPNWMEDTAPL